MNDPRQDRLMRFMEKHQVSARCGALLVKTRLAAGWNLPAPDVLAIVDPEAIDWHTLNPPPGHRPPRFPHNPAITPMLDKVTQAHIDNGSRSCTDCPIALAILEQLPDMATVEVDSNGVELISDHEEDNDIRCALPDEALTFINRFDSGAEVAPFEFRLHIPRFDWQSL